MGRKGLLMKHPLWILNSLLLILALAVSGVIFFTQERVPAREDIEPEEYVKPIQEDTSKINTSKIYEFDLFGTYKKEIPVPEEKSDVQPLPAPPEPQKVVVPQLPKPKFLEPLDISLKGIIAFLNDDTKNRAIIADNKTQKEKNYKVGDKIEDARLIRIFNNKIMFLRSNGQQEVLYLREQDAKLDPSYAMISDWNGIVEQVGTNDFTINTQEFTKKVKSLGQFIDMLDISTAYKEGSSIGCRIGIVDEKSLGSQLGLKVSDIVTQINGVPATTTTNRFNIYKKITGAKEDDTVTVILTRDNQEITIEYTLQELAPIKVSSLPAPPPEPEKVRDKQLKALQEKYKFAPTLDEIRKKEKRNMMQRGRLLKKPNKTG